MTTPLARLLKLYHAALWSNGAWTVPVTRKGAGDNMDDLFTAALKVKEADEDE